MSKRPSEAGNAGPSVTHALGAGSEREPGRAELDSPSGSRALRGDQWVGRQGASRRYAVGCSQPVWSLPAACRAGHDLVPPHHGCGARTSPAAHPPRGPRDRGLTAREPDPHSDLEPTTPFAVQAATLLLPPSHDPSFPSDHATFAFAIAVGLFLVSKRVGVLALILAALIGLARVYTGEHYVSDVIGGALIGSGAMLAAARARRVLEPLLASALRLARSLHLA